MGGSREAFGEAADWFVRTTAEVGDRWEQPGLGEWDVRALVGHGSRSFVTVESYLGQPAASVEIASTLDYYRATSAIAAGPGVAQRGRDAGAALGVDPAAAVAELASGCSAAVDSCDGTELLTSIVGGMRRTDRWPFELSVHAAATRLLPTSSTTSGTPVAAAPSSRWPAASRSSPPMSVGTTTIRLCG